VINESGDILNSHIPVADFELQQVINQRNRVLGKLSHVHTTTYSDTDTTSTNTSMYSHGSRLSSQLHSWRPTNSAKA